MESWCIYMCGAPVRLSFAHSGLGYVPLRRLPPYKTTKLRSNADYGRVARVHTQL